MTEKGYGYDPECGFLAEYFLSSLARPDLVSRLAQQIQNAIEQWLRDEIASGEDRLRQL